MIRKTLAVLFGITIFPAVLFLGIFAAVILAASLIGMAAR